ncbi:MmyB family transcriptional regulator [Streptacidiphilus griseoplanus]|uniref:MmyB family transcriptional regulator n=1 Tax=Peterkaempfera griseoplana TaxID=66896 RepID=UPI0006E40A66|nr:helix-turn-helix domain-containing protein [Peterkaempfera griseoplana]
MTTTPAPATGGVGPLLRRWRERRRVSQLDLALTADSSARHISYIENGRSRPSQEMVLKLAEHLDVPLRERNALLLAAGYAPVFRESSYHDPDDPGMAAVRAALEGVLRGHEPCPAVVLDAGHDVLAANSGMAALLEGIPGRLLQPPLNLIRIALHPQGLAPRIVNLGQVRRHLLERVERHLSIWDSEPLRRLYAEVSGYPGPEGDDHAEDPAQTHPSVAAVALPVRLRTAHGELAFISTIATFNTPLDVAVSELAIEHFLPADPATADIVRRKFPVTRT